jgi:enoyl-CoA hydratase/carnithine racemase
MTQEAVVLFEEKPCANGGVIGVATLNAPKSLNSLTTDMIDVLMPRLKAWAADDQVHCVWLQGAGEKALCAGGDIVKIYKSMVAAKETGSNVAEEAETFFEKEYRLDYLIHTFPKPIIVWANGVVMGGGLGITVGADLRIVTETTKMAMPEITIGLYPDVGGTWFLNRMPGHCGLFLGVTGARINAADAIFTGLADVFMPAAEKDSFFKTLEAAHWTHDIAANRRLLHSLSRGFAKEHADAMPASKVREHYDVIQRIADVDHILDFQSDLNQITEADGKWLHMAKLTLAKGSPISAHVIFEQIKRGAHLSLVEAFQRELGLSVQFTRFPDLAEGVRALLIDKDQNPQWEFKSLADVPADRIETYFASPWGEGANPLQSL